MKKLVTMLVAVSMTVGLLTGCSGSQTAETSTTARTPEGDATDSTGEGTGNQDTTEGAADAASDLKTGGELNLFTWEGMFPQEVLDDFTAQTGIKVNYSSFDTDETMLAKLETAKGGSYDLIVADDYIIETVIAQNLAQKLDRNKITNYDNIDTFYQGQFFDPQNEYTVPYGAGVQTIIYNPELATAEINNYEDLWDSALAGSIGITSNFRVMNGMALKINGESYNTEDIAAINAAGEKMLELAPNIRLIKDDNLQDDLISGEISAGVMYTSQATIALMNNPELKQAYPGEGIGFGIMAQFIPVNAPNADAAYAFIDYILQPEAASKCFQFLGYYCTNKAAYDLIEDGMKDKIILPEELKSNTEMIQNISADAVEEHTKVWTQFKSACGQ